jgi:hypothetical protein
MLDHYLLWEEEHTIRSQQRTDDAAPAPGATPPPEKRVATEWDMSESFRRARSAISGVTRDLETLHRHARTLVKRSGRPAR